MYKSVTNNKIKYTVCNSIVCTVDIQFVTGNSYNICYKLCTDEFGGLNLTNLLSLTNIEIKL